MLRRRFLSDRPHARKGAVAVVVAFCMIPLIGVLALALDGGMLMAERRQVQSAADFAAHAAACILYKNFSTDHGLDPSGKARTAALAYAAANGYTNDGTKSTVTVNIPPPSGTSGAQSVYPEVVVRANRSRGFSAIWGGGTLAVEGRCTARVKESNSVYSPASLILLDPAASGSLSVSGTAKVVANHSIQVNSNHLHAVTATNSGSVTLQPLVGGTDSEGAILQVVGNTYTSSGGQIKGEISSSAAPSSNPLATMVPPDPTSLTTRGAVPTYGTFTMNPGVYNGGVTLGGGATVTMNPGIYYMKSGGFTVANGVTITGAGVTIYVDNGGGQFSFQGGGVINMSAPTTGPYAGVVMYQDPNSTKAISIANGSTTTITGTVYAAGAAMSIAGGAANSQYGSQIIARSLNVSNNANIKVTGDPDTIARGRSLTLNIVE